MLMRNSLVKGISVDTGKPVRGKRLSSDLSKYSISVSNTGEPVPLPCRRSLRFLCEAEPAEAGRGWMGL